MWRALQVLEAGPLTVQVTALELESRAVRQWEAVEERRRALVAMTFPMLESTAPPRAG
jgi:hypothetical protein